MLFQPSTHGQRLILRLTCATSCSSVRPKMPPLGLACQRRMPCGISAARGRAEPKGSAKNGLYLAFFVEQGRLSRLAGKQICQTYFPSVLHFLCSRSEWISCSAEARHVLRRDGYPKGCPGGEILQRSETQRVVAPVPREQGGGTLPGAGVLVLLFGLACEKILRLPNIPQILSFMPDFDGLGNCAH